MTNAEIQALLDLEAQVRPGELVVDGHVVYSLKLDGWLKDDIFFDVQIPSDRFGEQRADYARLLVEARKALRPLAEEVLRLRSERR